MDYRDVADCRFGDSAANPSQNRHPLKIKEAAAILIRRQHADFGAAEDAVAAAGDAVVDGVSEGFGQELQEGCECAPGACQLL